MHGSLRVVIVEDHPMMREALCSVISSEPGLEVVGQAGDGVQAVELALRLLPDVLVMDLNLPAKDGIAAIAEILGRQADMRILAITSSTENSRVVEAVEAGVLGYLLKDASRAEFLHTIREVAHGRTCLPAGVAAKLAQGIRHAVSAADMPSDGLTSREREILALLGEGLSNHRIAALLCLSEATVRVHVRNILQKLGFEERGQAMLYAMRRPANVPAATPAVQPMPTQRRPKRFV